LEKKFQKTVGGMFLTHTVGVHSTKHRHQSPEWLILHHVIQGEVYWISGPAGCLCPRSMRASRWSPPVFNGKLLRSSWNLSRLAFVPNREKCRAWTIACLSVSHPHSAHGLTMWFRQNVK